MVARCQRQQPQPEKTMPKAYWIVHVTVHDPEHYPEYLAVALPIFEKYGANFVVRGIDKMGKARKLVGSGVSGNVRSGVRAERGA